MKRALVGLVAPLLSAAASAAPILAADFSASFDGGAFGPFGTTQAIYIRATLRNVSDVDSLTVCPGVCTGGPSTYSLGGIASVPTGYSFVFGASESNTPDGFEGQTVGALAPGESRDFIFGIYTPTQPLAAGWYSFWVQLQIFDATPDRPMVGASSFSGRWEVLAPAAPVPVPGTLALAVAALSILWYSSRRQATGSGPH
jgi:hypothetical protein